MRTRNGEMSSNQHDTHTERFTNDERAIKSNESFDK